MESMTNAPHLLPKSREGFKYGDTTLVDSMAYDALWDQATDQAMGALTDLADIMGDREAAVCRELTKTFEEFRRGALSELAAHYENVDNVKGEIVLVVAMPGVVPSLGGTPGGMTRSIHACRCFVPVTVIPGGTALTCTSKDRSGF